MKIYAISGSLRKHSVNKKLLQAVYDLLPSHVEWQTCELLGSLPLFNPDLEGKEPKSVIQFREELKQADGVIIASPEYAHGITGALKNGLDWIVGSGEFVFKPVAVLNASSRAIHADEALKEVLKTMDAKIIQEACRRVPLYDNRMTKEMILAEPQIVQVLQEMLSRFLPYLEMKKRKS